MIKKGLFCLLILGCLQFPFSAKATEEASSDNVSIDSEISEISNMLRCLSCSEESLERAEDEAAQDIRFFIRQQLQSGKNKEVVLHLLFAQYGGMISLEDDAPKTIKNEKRFAVCLTLFCFFAMFFYLFKRTYSFKA